MDEDQRNKQHKSRSTGNKAVRKDELRKKKAGIDLQPNRGRNPKAFQGPSAASHKSQLKMRSVEKKESVLHLPSSDKTLSHILNEPPLLVAVVGPPGVGKTTLIRSMVKFYSGKNVLSLRGPVTVVAGRSRRVTFIECPNTLTAMCDVAKVADLILLMVDGNFGFEMETFEFLSIAQVHGFPKIFGVVSHLDQMKTSKALRKQKKFLRHRFWHEVAAGAKLLCLSPMHHGTYRQNDVLKLHRLLICVQPKIQLWRNTHSCVLVDRHEDISDPATIQEDPNANRTVAFYGYVRGKPMKANGEQMVHIPGLGDFPVTHISHQEDPCEYTGNTNVTGGHRMRHLNQKQKRLYAPYCDVGGVTYDENAIYIQRDGEFQDIERSGEGFEMLRELQHMQPMDAVARDLDVIRRPVHFRDEDTLDIEMDEPRMPNDADDSDADSDDSDDPNEATLRGETSKKKSSTFDLDDFGTSVRENGGDDGNEAAFQDMPEAVSIAPRLPNALDAIRLNQPKYDWSHTGLLRRVKEYFVTGSWQGSNPTYSGKGGATADDDDDDDGHRPTAEDKGYDSNDEEFDAEARGDATGAGGGKQNKSRRQQQHLDSDDDVEGSDNDDDSVDEMSEDGSDDDDRVKAAGAFDALSGLASSGLHGRSAVSTTSGKKGTSGNKSGKVLKRDPSKFESYGEGDAEGSDDDFDILAESEDAIQAGSGFQDADLQGLVAHFTKPSKALEDTDGVELIDHAKLHKKEYVDANEEEEEARLDAAVQSGAPLSEEQEKLMKKRMAKKQNFDEGYDVDGGKNHTMGYYHHLQQDIQAKKEALDKAVEMAGEDLEQKIRLVGYFSGLYVRFVISGVPVEFLKHFDPRQPLIAGGLNLGEEHMQVVTAKIKRHRWYPKILKAQDPLLISIGWRRIQTQPIFAQEDPNGRMRYLKYTPLHMHCYCAFYAPVAPTNTGFVAIPVQSTRVSNFRCFATGYTVGNDACTSIVKKLKLTGTPQKIEKTTAFIKSMFNSDIEAAKFIGAKLKTVSGVRGIIKAVIKGKGGVIRATFEDKILPSDIVFIRAWKPVDPPHYCAMMRNLVDPSWTGMKSMRELRLANNIPIQPNPDSEYREIKRRRTVNEDEPQRILLSRSTKMSLPFDFKEEFIPLAKSDVVTERIKASTTVAPELREMRKQALLDVFTSKADAVEAKRKEAKNIARERVKRVAEREANEYERKLKQAKKETARKQEFRSQHKTRK